MASSLWLRHLVHQFREHLAIKKENAVRRVLQQDNVIQNMSAVLRNISSEFGLERGVTFRLVAVKIQQHRPRDPSDVVLIAMVPSSCDIRAGRGEGWR